ncbi:hypothetical protein GXP67_13460 [Rhodocytophaga rosea]|uniref:Uncharacterized protein n=1 Tax=Rhodocytophaga rosea TaxID=2704465 RepID=A0A6C0GIQ9_9BACT|nr:hypothetical protein [Rhodocytophaga rosea]QHT67563.1 hypothetical protein GXP67_13460 [Rhodocytophaga rosea]
MQYSFIKWLFIFGTYISGAFFNECAAQSYAQQQRQIAAYNILLNGCIGGIGGVINKKKEDKALAAFGRNFLKGSLGGLVKYTAKSSLYALPEKNRALASFANRAYYYLGHSFTMNASLNRELLHTYNIQLYGIDLNIQLTDDVKIQPRLSLLTSYYFLLTITNKHTFNLSNSIKYGVFYFNQHPKYNYSSDGNAFQNTIILNPLSLDYNSTVSHELVHTYQFPDYYLISNFGKPWVNKLNTYKIYKSLNKFLYMDISYIQLLYNLKPNFLTTSAHYFKNFYEFEAQHFATREYIMR